MNGSIDNRPDRPRPWRARYPGPDRRQKSRSFKTKKEAQAWLRDEIGKLDRGTWIDPARGKQLYDEYVTDWLNSRVRITEKTRVGYEGLLRSRVLPRFGNYELRRIDAQSIRAWIADMHEEGLSASRIRQAHQVLSASLRQALSDGLIGRNPAVDADLPREPHREMLHLTATQVRHLATLCEERQPGAGSLVTFLAWSGLRWSEAVALRRSSLNDLKHTVVVKEAATEVGGRLVWGDTKNHRSRNVVIPRPVFELLEENTHATHSSELVFTAPRGGPLRSGNFRRRVWEPAVAQLIRMHPSLDGVRIHDLRHTAASLAISSGGNIVAIRQMLGHKDASITLNRYGHLYDDDLIELAQRLEEKYLAA